MISASGQKEMLATDQVGFLFWKSLERIMRIQDMPGLGKKSAEMLAKASIVDVEDLKKKGSVQAFLAVRRTGIPVSLNLLWALEGALTGEHWQHVARTHRMSLLIALEDAGQ